ncbi:MAG: hypothetical protein H0V17_11740 [Deltaproteobacteria bacterium]|nr:hypothetical protein [Deltaproteobacteria bacterium]
MSFDGWLDARDSATVEREWATLGGRRIELGQSAPRYLAIKPEGAALLAAGFLGCSPDRFGWWATDRNRDPPWPPATFQEGRGVSRSFFDHELQVDEQDAHETFTIREVIEGTRGVQHITIDCSWGEMTREGGSGRSMTFVRVFDRSTQRAVSIPLYSTGVWMVGDVDLSPLDLFAQRVEYKLAWKRHDTDAVRGFLAQLAADLDAHFDVSPSWPGGVIEDRVIESVEYNFRTRKRVQRFESAPFAIQLDENLDPDTNEGGMMWATVQGLPWGHELNVRICNTDDPVWGVDGWIDFTLPRAQLEAALARTAAIPGIQVGP